MVRVGTSATTEKGASCICGSGQLEDGAAPTIGLSSARAGDGISSPPGKGNAANGVSEEEQDEEEERGVECPDEGRPVTCVPAGVGAALQEGS